MLESTKINVTVKNARDGQIEKIYQFTRFDVRYHEKEAILNKKSFSTACNDIRESDLKTVEWKTASESDIKAILKNEKYSDTDIETFLNDRKNLIDIEKDIASLKVTEAEFKELAKIDRVFIDLQAHTALSSVTIAENILADVDFSKMVSTYRTDGTIKDIKDTMKSAFNNLLNVDNGTLFYGVKLKKSDIPSDLIRDYIGLYTKAPKRKVKTYHDGSKEYKEFVFTHTEASKKTQDKLTTDLFAVILDAKNVYDVVKPDKKAEATAK